MLKNCTFPVIADAINNRVMKLRDLEKSSDLDPDLMTLTFDLNLDPISNDIGRVTATLGPVTVSKTLRDLENVT